MGEDQRQHLELSRTLAQRFNHRYGQTFVPPQPYILAEVAKIYDLQDPTAKMSKSSSSPQGIVDVLDDPGAIRRKIARAVTDAGSEVRADAEAKPGVTNLLRIYSALAEEPVAVLEAKYAGRGLRGVQEGSSRTGRGNIRPDQGEDRADPGRRGRARPCPRRRRRPRAPGRRPDDGGRPRSHGPAQARGLSRTLKAAAVKHGTADGYRRSRCPRRAAPRR